MYLILQLVELGQLCGLMPGSETTSEHLHTVVLLSAGIGDTPATLASTRLRHALSSKEAFKKQYLVRISQTLHISYILRMSYFKLHHQINNRQYSYQFELPIYCESFEHYTVFTLHKTSAKSFDDLSRVLGFHLYSCC